jgi:hypothetical protein
MDIYTNVCAHHIYESRPLYFDFEGANCTKLVINDNYVITNI